VTIFKGYDANYGFYITIVITAREKPLLCRSIKREGDHSNHGTSSTPSVDPSDKRAVVTDCQTLQFCLNALFNFKRWEQPVKRLLPQRRDYDLNALMFMQNIPLQLMTPQEIDFNPAMLIQARQLAGWISPPHSNLVIAGLLCHYRHFVAKFIVVHIQNAPRPVTVI
jgi:hypothetical protein